MAAQNPSSESKASAPLGAVAFTLALSAAAISLRLAARRCAKRRLWVDDYFALASFLSILGTAVAICFMISSGLGRHIWTLSKGEIQQYLKAYYISTAFYYLGLLTAKMAFMFQYLKILGHNWSRHGWFYVLTAVIGAWGLAELLINVLICIPLEGFWDSSVSARCIPDQPQRYIFIAGDIFSGLTILLLPAMFMYALSVGRPEAVSIAIIYTLGLFVVVLQFVRIPYVDLGINFTWVSADRAGLMMAELSVALVCSCALALHPLAERFMPRWFCILTFEGLDRPNGSGGRHHGSNRRVSQPMAESWPPDRDFMGRTISPQQQRQHNRRSPSSFRGFTALENRLYDSNSFPSHTNSARFTPSPVGSINKLLPGEPRLLLQKVFNHTPRTDQQLPYYSGDIPLPPPPPPPQSSLSRVDDSGDASEDVVGLQAARRAMKRASYIRGINAAAAREVEDHQQVDISMRGKTTTTTTTQIEEGMPPPVTTPFPLAPSPSPTQSSGGLVVHPPPTLAPPPWGGCRSTLTGTPPPRRSSSTGRSPGGGRNGGDASRGGEAAAASGGHRSEEAAGWRHNSLSSRWAQYPATAAAAHDEEEHQQHQQQRRPATVGHDGSGTQQHRSASYHAIPPFMQQLPPPQVHVTHGFGIYTERRPPSGRS